MTDRYENIRRALAMGPTPGPWVPKELPRDMQRDGYRFSISRGGLGWWIAKVTHEANGGSGAANAALIAACDHDTIRELLAERDQLAAALEAARKDAERLAFLAREPVIEEINGVKKSIYDYAAMIAEENGRDEPNYEDYTNGMRRLIDAAIDQAMKEQA